MTPERLTQLRQIVEYFNGATPTDAEIAAYCAKEGFETIDAGTLEDWTFSYDVEQTRNMCLPEICKVIGAWTPPSENADKNEQQGAFRALERSILAIFEDRDVPFN